MRAFHFRLQALLNLREIAREEALTAYAKSIRRRELEEKELAACSDRLEKLRGEIAIRRSEGFTGAEQSAYLRAVSLAKERIQRQRGKLERARRSEEEARTGFLKADGDEKSLTRLKERREEEHFSTELKKEERELEDVISTRYCTQNDKGAKL